MAATYQFTSVLNTDKFKLMNDFQDGSQKYHKMKNLPTLAATLHFYLVLTCIQISAQISSNLHTLFSFIILIQFL